MLTDKDVSEINLAKDYTKHLWDIGKTFLQSFKKRSQTLPGLSCIAASRHQDKVPGNDSSAGVCRGES